MGQPPNPLSIYHITHIDNLPHILADGGLLSDARIRAAGGPAGAIGMSKIKDRRLRLPVHCHPGDCVGDYVPFYFCPRSIMLYVIHRADNPELAYKGGQGPILHLESNLHEVVAWADAQPMRWAFSLSNAGAAYCEFRNVIDSLHEVDWQSVAARDFRPSEVKEGKQAEFLVHGFFPWHLVRRIGVRSVDVQARVIEAVANAQHKPDVLVIPNWYY